MANRTSDTEDTATEHKGHGGMARRGVSRPMAEHEVQAKHDGGDGKDGHGEPYSPRRYEMLWMHHRQTLWVYGMLILLGL